MNEQPPVPPPVQRRQIEAPPVIRTEDPPVQSPHGTGQFSDRLPGDGSRWNWWPDHPGKRLMVLATACWLCLLIPTYLWGLSMPYRYTDRPSPDGFYVSKLDDSDYFTEEEIAIISSETGVLYLQRLSMAFAAALLVGGVVVMAVDRKK